MAHGKVAAVLLHAPHRLPVEGWKAVDASVRREGTEVVGEGSGGDALPVGSEFPMTWCFFFASSVRTDKIITRP
jgi:hypothetical protein